MKLRQLKGTREYLPEQQILREYIVDVLKTVFKKYGYKPIETSILEFYDIAASKYAGGEEILKEIYRLKDNAGRQLCLRYELTFKLAKLVGLNPNIKLPLKRYEIGKVFRDGPVKTGRLREFTQCDVDCVGTSNLAVDAELIALAFDVFNALSLDVYVLVNNRKLLFGLFEYCGIDKKKFVDAALCLDKLEKIGKQEVAREMKQKGISEKCINQLFSIIDEVQKLKSNKQKLDFVKKKLNNELAQEGIAQLEQFFDFCDALKLNQQNIVLALFLARGLAYYTGMMWEFYLKNSSIKSSVAAGGRWDEMIQNFLQCKQQYPATGMSFGLDVIYEALKEKKLAIPTSLQIPKVLIIPINTLKTSMEIAQKLREAGISTDISIDKKLSKALDYANKLNIPFCIIVGSKELQQDKVKLRDMQTGKEQLLTLTQVIKKLK